MSAWLQHNLYFGYTIQLVSFLAILYTIFRELWTHNTLKSKSEFLEEFYTTHGVLWTLSLLLSVNIILRGYDCDYYMYVLNTSKIHSKLEI